MSRPEGERIFVAMPSFDGMCTTGLAHLCYEFGRESDKFVVARLDGVKGIPAARNFLTEKFLESDCDRIWFLDDDVIPPDNLAELLHVEGDIVGATYRCLQKGLTGATSIQRMPPDLPDKGVHPVAYVPFGSVLIDRRVFEDEKMLLGPANWYREVLDSQWNMMISDDVDFCSRASEAGYDTVCVAHVEFGHKKLVDLNVVAHEVIKV